MENKHEAQLIIAHRPNSPTQLPSQISSLSLPSSLRLAAAAARPLLRHRTRAHQLRRRCFSTAASASCYLLIAPSPSRGSAPSSLDTFEYSLGAFVISAHGVTSMAAVAAPMRAEVLSLFRSLLRTARQFSDYNIREYTRRRAADAFRENHNLGDAPAITAAFAEGKKQLEVAKRQAMVYSLYAPKAKSIMDMKLQ
uniref:Complex 1 LYR protein domain-containing protein n=1 Tax=Leersia perrieri TaxID=77586 RepID=A0A0D9WUB6_9ORYZ